MVLAGVGHPVTGPCRRCSGPGSLVPTFSGVLGLPAFYAGWPRPRRPAVASLPTCLARQCPHGYGHGSLDLRPSSPSLPSSPVAVVSPRGGLCLVVDHTLYASKPPPFARSNARGSGGGATLRRQVQPHLPPSSLVVPASVGSLIQDSIVRFDGSTLTPDGSRVRLFMEDRNSPCHGVQVYDDR